LQLGSSWIKVWQGSNLVQERETEALQALLSASENEKETRGVQYTPLEIFHQPATWETTYKICAERRRDLSQFLRESGIGTEAMPWR